MSGLLHSFANRMLYGFNAMVLLSFSLKSDVKIEQSKLRLESELERSRHGVPHSPDDQCSV